ncbi:MAG: glycosyltransferase family 39 protein [Acidimicrobiales bacterium]
METRTATPSGRAPNAGQLQRAESRPGVSGCAWVVPTALTLVLGGIFLGRASLWTDESATWVNSVQPVSNIISNSGHVDAVFLPYYLFMHLWVEVSQSAWWMRLPSLLSGAAAVAALVLLARRWLPPAWCAVAGFLLALNPLFARWTIEARPYAAATFFAVLSTAALVAAIDRPGALRLARFGLASLCMLLLYLLSAFVLVAQIAGLVIARRRPAWRGMALTLAFVAVAVSPLAVAAAGQTRLISWIPRSTVHTFRYALGDVTGGTAEGAVLVICGAILVAVIASSAPGSDEALSSALCLSWGALPPLLLVLVGFVHPLYVDRYTLVCLPGIALVEAMAAWRAWTVLTSLARTARAPGRETKVPPRVVPAGHHHGQPRWPSAVVATGLGGLGIAGLLVLASNTSHGLRARYYGDDFRSAAAALSRDLLQHPAPVMVTPNWAEVGFSYYATPTALARALDGQAAQALDHETIDWENGKLARDGELPDSTVLRWPPGAERPTPGCAVGWVIGRGLPAPATTFIVDGSSCRLSGVQYYGAVWVAAAGA